MRGTFPGIPLIALTATADEATRADVREKLHLLEAPEFVAGFDRPNIRYTVVEKSRPAEQLLAFLRSRPGDSGIVYCLSRRRTEEVAARLVAEGIAAAAYHAGLPGPQRTRVQDDFLRDRLQVVVATVAFGMGIDKPDVRFVVHHDMPKNIEGYYQETGRAGRDGMPAEALLLFGMQDVMTARGLIEGGSDPAQVRVELHKLNAMIGFAESPGCRRRAMLGYFGEELAQRLRQLRRLPRPARALRRHGARPEGAVLRLPGRAALRRGHVVEVLRGADTARIRDLGHNRLSTWGIGRELSAAAWLSLIRQLIHHGLLRQDITAYSVLKLMPPAWPVLRGERRIELAVPREREGRKPAAKKRERLTADGRTVDDTLFERLRALRRRLAEEQGVPAYVVFSDATLAAMAALKPQTTEEMLRVSGVGQTKLARYGQAFLAVLVAANRGAS